MTQPIYLDHAAATPLDPKVLAAMQPYLVEQFYNPSATYLAAKKVRRAVDDARARTAKALGVRPREIIFTAGATEANNLAIHGVMGRFPKAKVLVSAVEHDSVLEAAKQHKHAIIPVENSGHVKQAELKKLLADDVVLVSVIYANNEIGTVQHLSSINAILSEVRATRLLKGNMLPLYLHTDAAQAPNYLTVYAKRIGVDMMSLNGGKIYGPKQSGALFINTGVEIDPIIQGGGQEFGMRSGTENVAGIVGFSEALEQAVLRRSDEQKCMQALWKEFHDRLSAQLPKLKVTVAGQSLPNIMHVTIPGVDNERLMMELDEQGIICAVGSACSASNDEPSHVLKAIGFSDSAAQTSLRFSMGRSTSEADVTTLVDTLAKLLA